MFNELNFFKKIPLAEWYEGTTRVVAQIGGDRHTGTPKRTNSGLDC
jgi:hypothetical protein